MDSKIKETKSFCSIPHNESKRFVGSDSFSRDISQLEKRIALPMNQLMQCTNNQDKFETVLSQLNAEGIARIHNQDYEESLVYFKEAERILQYVAGCGKIIDRKSIIVVLHNLACSYQKLYDLPKVSSYLQALIYNIGVSLQSSQTHLSLNFQDQKAFTKGTSEFDALSNYIAKKKQYGQYHLQYAAVNSKNYEHQAAIIFAKQSIEIQKQICKVCARYQSSTKGVHSPHRSSQSSLLLNLSKTDVELKSNNYELYCRQIKKILNGNSPNKEHSYYHEVSEEYSNYTIGKIVQIAPMTVQECMKQADLSIECNIIEKIRKALFIAAGYFTVGTEYRLLASTSQSKNQNCKSLDEFLYSQMYHLYCIYIVLNYVPCQTLFLKNLMTSYSNHYQGDLQKSMKKRPNNQDGQLGKDELLIEMLPEHSQIQEGESKWSRSQLKSLSSENASENNKLKKVSKEKNNVVMVKKKCKVGIQYRVNFNNMKSIVSHHKTSSADKSTDSFRDKQAKIEYSVKKNSVRSLKNSQSKGQKSKKISVSVRKSEKSLGSKKPTRRNSKKEKVSGLHKDTYLGQNQYYTKKHQKNNSKSKAKSKSRSMKQLKKSKDKQSNDKLEKLAEKSHRRMERDEHQLKKSKSKKSIDSKRRSKKTIKI